MMGDEYAGMILQIHIYPDHPWNLKPVDTRKVQQTHSGGLFIPLDVDNFTPLGFCSYWSLFLDSVPTQTCFSFYLYRAFLPLCR